MHKPVLLKEVIIALDIQPSDKVVDGTVGGGGYLREICNLLNGEGLAIGLDQDNSALEKVRGIIQEENYKCKAKLINENFRNIDKVLNDLGIKKINKFVLDLGISSNQLDDSGRGFSFLRDEPLLMTLKKNLTENDLTAKEIVNEWGRQSLIDIIYGYGEESFAKKIVAGIDEARKKKSIETTFELVEIIKQSVPKWYQSQRIHFATKTFQALRIAVNDEMRALQEGLRKGFDKLDSDGRMVIVSFHSKEDRVVKRFFKEKKLGKLGKLLVKKPLTPTRDEVKENSRSRSAKLRVIQKL